jgi:uncharacterized membrane protein
MPNSMSEQTQHLNPAPKAYSEGLASVLERNIDTLVARRRQQEQDKGRQERIADAITGFTGSMTFVYLHILFFGSWILINLGLTPLPRYDPSFVILAMMASVEAIFLSTFVLISQNRMAAVSDKRAELDLQISLLSEHEITQMLELMIKIAEQIGVQHATEPKYEELIQSVDPEAVLNRLEENA